MTARSVVVKMMGLSPLLVGRRLFQRIELLAVQVLDQRVAEQVIVLGLLDDGADLGR